MKNAALLVAASFLFATHALAQSAAPANVPPPPGLNDPGVKAVAPAAPASARTTGKSLKLKPQSLPSMRDEGGAQAAPRDQSPPQVRIRQEGDNSIQEYSRNGRVYMVVVTPKNGIQQTYLVDPQGRLVDEHGMKPVGPVMYKVLEWGKSRPPATESSAPAAEDGGH